MLNLSLCFLTTRSLFVAFPSLHAYISLLSLCFSCGSFANWSIQKKFSFTSTPKMLYLNHIYGICLPPYTHLFIQASSLGMVVNLQSEDWGGRDLTGQLWVNEWYLLRNCNWSWSWLPCECVHTCVGTTYVHSHRHGPHTLTYIHACPRTCVHTHTLKVYTQNTYKAKKIPQPLP